MQNLREWEEFRESQDPEGLEDLLGNLSDLGLGKNRAIIEIVTINSKGVKKLNKVHIPDLNKKTGPISKLDVIQSMVGRQNIIGKKDPNSEIEVYGEDNIEAKRIDYAIRKEIQRIDSYYSPFKIETIFDAIEALFVAETHITLLIDGKEAHKVIKKRWS